MKGEILVNIKQKKLGFQKRISQILFLIILFFDGIALREVNSQPSDNYKKESNCWYNPDFVTRDQISDRYCINQNSEIIRIDKNGKVYEERGKLNEVVKINSFPVSKLYEFKIEYDQLIQYSCKGRKYETEFNCKKSSERIIKGVRPKGFHLNKGLEQKSKGDISSAVNSFKREIDVTKNPLAFLELALIRNEQNNYVEALKYINRIKDEDPLSKEKYYLSSLIKYNMKAYKASINDIEKLLDIINNDIEKSNLSNQNIKTLDTVIKNNTAYVLVEGPSWEEASINAKKLGGYLVTINDEEENNWLVDNFFDSDKFYSKSSKNKFWIGLSFINEQLNWSSKETFSFTKLGPINSYPNSESVGVDLYAKINIIDSSDNSKVDQGSWSLEPSAGNNNNASYGIAEINILDKFENVQPKFKKLFFLRGIARSKLGMSELAIKDFDKDIEINPLNGQSYFERGMEKYFSDRENSCKDMLKGLNLGADYKSYQDFTNGKKLNDLEIECKIISNDLSINKEKRYKFQESVKNLIMLFKKYIYLLFIIIPIGITILWKKEE